MVVAADIRTILTQAWPGRFAAEDLTVDALLGEGGIGLDSVELAEVLIACEEATGRHLDPELLTGKPLTVGSLIDHFSSS
ncbi:MAG: hypothetical protein QOI80_1961 [Solirubrobacteraceae bacterium]|jgi:acyl carrier protein|nr:hypothetical protein [Solirubrobacteraceae bacterium]